MENRYLSHLPVMVKDLQEFQKLGAVEGQILLEEGAAKDRLIRNQWIQTADRSGLLRLAKIMAFLGAETMETEALRAEMLLRWNSSSIYTRFHLADWLDTCCGTGTYMIVMDQENYRLQLVLGLQVKEKKEFLEKQLRRVIPANLVLDVDLNTNTYGDVKIFTYGMLKEMGWTYGQIPYEDLTPYK